MNMPDHRFHMIERPDIPRPHPAWNDNGNLEFELSADEREALDEFRIKHLVESFEASLRAIAHMRRHNEIPAPDRTLESAHTVLRWMTALEEEVIASGQVGHDRTAGILGVPRSTAQSRRKAVEGLRTGETYRSNIAFRRGDETAASFYAPKGTAPESPRERGLWTTEDGTIFKTPRVTNPAVVANVTGDGAVGHVGPDAVVTVDNSVRYDAAEPRSVVSAGDVTYVGGNINGDDLSLQGPGGKTLRTGPDGRREFEVKGLALRLNGIDVSMTVGEVREVSGWELSATFGGSIVGREL